MTFIKNISPGQSPDQELLSAYYETGDINLLSDLYQRYMELVFGVCLKYLKDTEKSRDAVMDIFEELVKKLRQHRVDNFRSWLHTLAKNHCLGLLRSPKNLKTTAFEPEFMQSAEENHLPNEVFEREAVFGQLQQCIDNLPGAQQQAIRLFFLEKKCYQEIAVITGYEWNKVRSYIQNGKRNLKLCMERPASTA